MNDFIRYNKISGTYWLKRALSAQKIKVKLKSQNPIISLPKFEAYASRSNLINLENSIEEYIFKWQEKVFSLSEVQRYADHHNCVTDNELNYHEILKNSDKTSCKVFTYVHEDCYVPIPLDGSNKKNSILKLEQYLTKLSLNGSTGKILGRGKSTSSIAHLYKSEENVDTDQEEWMAMHIVFDNSDYNEDSQLVYKQEVTLVSLYYNTVQNYLIVTPDVNNLELNPYIVETTSGMQLGYQYSIEIEFDDSAEYGDELVMLLRKLHKRWERKRKHLLNFQMPPIGTRQYYVTLEILRASEFDTQNLYLEFDIKIPKELERKDGLHGRTHSSELIKTENGDEWNFGHIVEFAVEADRRIEPAPIKLFFEAISSDWWGRHRTEGYAYLSLPLKPGCDTKELRCTRPEELNTVDANSRRFFLGGCHLIKDLNVLVEPQLKDANFSYTTTGLLTIRWNIIAQCQVGAISNTMSEPIYGTGTASALLRGAETALQKYRRARARLAAATGQPDDEQASASHQPSPPL